MSFKKQETVHNHSQPFLCWICVAVFFVSVLVSVLISSGLYLLPDDFVSTEW